jgi:hypothetical protein
LKTKDDLNYGPETVDAHFRLSQFEVDWARALKPNKDIMYTKSSHQSDIPCLHVYPDFVKVNFKSSTLEHIRQFQGEWMSKSEPAALQFLDVSPIESTHIYVCCHMTRDVRCGVIGKVLINQLREYLASPPEDISALKYENVEVYGCSHVGGHKYAGNMIIYRPGWKQGVWYGRVLPEDIDSIIRTTVLEGKIIAKHWRGGLPSGRWYPKERMSAQEAEEQSREWKCACQE